MCRSAGRVARPSFGEVIDRLFLCGLARFWTSKHVVAEPPERNPKNWRLPRIGTEIATFPTSHSSPTRRSVMANAANAVFHSPIPHPEPSVESRAQRLETQARRVLAQHPHFLGKSQFVSCQCEGRCLRLAGRLPSYFLKQLAQEALRDLAGIEHIDNQIVVASPSGEVWPRYQCSESQFTI